MALVLVVTMVVSMMLVLAMKVFGQAVITAMEKFKFNLTMMIRTDHRLSKTASVREETGNNQKPDS